MNFVQCVTPGCSNSECYEVSPSDGWRYVLPRPKKNKDDKIQPHDGTCEACFTAKSQRPAGKRMPGGSAFDKDIVEAGGVPIPPDRQKSLFE